MRSLPTTLVVVAVILTLVGIRELVRPKIPSPANGRLIGRTYTNSVFGFTLETPTNLPVWNQAALEKGIHKNLPRSRRYHVPLTFQSIEVPDMSIYNLLTLSRDTTDLTDSPWAVMTPTNVTLAVLAQRPYWRRGSADVADARTVLDYWHAILGNADSYADFPARNDVETSGQSEAAIGGRTFYRETFSAKRRGAMIRHRVYARMENGFALQFMLIAPTDADLEQLEQILATARFN